MDQFGPLFGEREAQREESEETDRVMRQAIALLPDRVMRKAIALLQAGETNLKWVVLGVLCRRPWDHEHP
jgi:hypothetical protein